MADDKDAAANGVLDRNEAALIMLAENPFAGRAFITPSIAASKSSAS